MSKRRLTGRWGKAADNKRKKVDKTLKAYEPEETALQWAQKRISVCLIGAEGIGICHFLVWLSQQRFSIYGTEQIFLDSVMSHGVYLSREVYQNTNPFHTSINVRNAAVAGQLKY